MEQLFLIGFEGMFMLFLSSILSIMMRKLFELANVVKEVQGQVKEIETRLNQISEYKVKN